MQIAGMSGIDPSNYTSWGALIAALSPSYALRNSDSGLTDGAFSLLPGAQILWADPGESGYASMRAYSDQPWNWKPAASDIAALNMANPNRSGWNIMFSPGPGDTIKRNDYAQDNGIPWGALLVLAAPLAVSALGVGAAGAGAGADVGAGAAVASTGFTAPTAAELSAFGADVGGMGITGAGGIGSVSSLVDAGIGGSLGYGTGAAVGGLAADQFANETAKLLQQQTLAQSGVDLLSTSLPTIDLGSSLLPSMGWKDLLSAAKLGASAATAVAKVKSTGTQSTPMQTYRPVYRATGNGLTTAAGGGIFSGDNSMLWLAGGIVAGLIFIGS